MIALSNAEKQRAYRERQAAKKVADELFDGQMVLTTQEFLDGVEFDEGVFYEVLEGLGEESPEYIEERDEVWQEAYDEAYKEAYEDEYKEAYDEAMEEAVAEGFDPDEDEDDEIRESADEVASEVAEGQARDEAEETVKEWESEIEDYWETRVVYTLEDLIAAYRAAHGLP